MGIISMDDYEKIDHVLLEKYILTSIISFRGNKMNVYFYTADRGIV